MSIKLTNVDNYSAIATAIRGKNGSSNTYKPNEMAQAITDIPTGGGGVNTTGWIDAYLTQDNTTYSTSATGTTYNITPNTEWNIVGHTANIVIPTTSTPQTYYLLYNGRNTQLSIGGGMMTLATNTTYYFIKSMNYRDINDLPRFGGTYYNQTSKYMYRLRPLIYTPTDYNVTANTKMDVILSITIGATIYEMSAGFKYRVYEPIDMSGKTYKDENDSPLANVSSVTLNKNTTTITEDTTETLTATVLPNNAIYKGVAWSTSDSGCVPVSNGVISPAYEGSATITATSLADNTKSASCSVTVNSSLQSWYLNPDSLDAKSYSNYYSTKVNDNHIYLETGMTPQSKTPYTGTLYLYVENNYTSKLNITNKGGWLTYSNTNADTNFVISPYYNSTMGTNYGGAKFTVLDVATEIKVKMVDGHIFIKQKVADEPVYPQRFTLFEQIFPISEGSQIVGVQWTPPNTTERALSWTTSDVNILQLTPIGNGEKVIATPKAVGSVTVTATSPIQGVPVETTTFVVTPTTPDDPPTGYVNTGITGSPVAGCSFNSANGSISYTASMDNLGVWNGTTYMKVVNLTNEWQEVYDLVGLSFYVSSHWPPTTNGCQINVPNTWGTTSVKVKLSQDGTKCLICRNGIS